MVVVEEKKAHHLPLAGTNYRKKNTQTATDSFMLPALCENPGMSLHIDGGEGV